MANKSDKSNVVALLLCVFAGFLGAHRFYVGKNGTGAVQLLCCVIPVFAALRLTVGESANAVLALALAVVALATLGGLVVWNLIDGALIVAQKFTDKEGNALTFS